MGRKPCCDKTGLKKGPWTPDEDQKLIDNIQKHGPGNWRTLPSKAGLQRCGKSCRLRWTNYLRPDIKRGTFSSEEEQTIIHFHSIVGNKWSAIAARLPGRTDNEIKNFWNTSIRKKLLRMGIDPVTHGPRLDVLDSPSILGILQSSSLLNLSVLLNLQNLLNPELLRLPVSFKSLPNFNTQNQILGNILVNNPDAHSAESEFLSQNMPSFDSMICSSADHLSSKSNNSDQCFSNDSSFSAVLSSLCSKSHHPFDSSQTFFHSNTSSEAEIDSYLITNVE